MGKYLKKFETHAEYESFADSKAYGVPNVSYCTQQNEVHYNEEGIILEENPQVFN